MQNRSFRTIFKIFSSLPGYYSLIVFSVLVYQAICFDECLPENHKTLDEEWRFHEYTSMTFNKQDDTQLKEGWYRFTNKAFRMLEKEEMFPGFVVRNRVRLIKTFEFLSSRTPGLLNKSR